MSALMPRRIVVASSNPHKVEEIAAVLGPLGVELLRLDQAGGGGRAEPEEDGETFEANARIKAIAYARAVGLPCLADDSGLEVDALGGEPGVRSARWSGVAGDRATRDAANNRLLVERIRGVPSQERSARFVCAMCLAMPDGSILAESRGTFEGVIVERPRGTNGFGYDPHLLLPGEGRTSAELSPQEKNARSHRGRAARAIAAMLLGSAVGG